MKKEMPELPPDVQKQTRTLETLSDDEIDTTEAPEILDWSDAMTPNGAVASASVAKVTCDIARCDGDSAPSYMIFCDRSFGQYLFDALIDAGEEFGLAVGLPNG